ncbi:MAG TPA: hypothetical protein VFB82_00835 [Blastocatellia bacterium]|nr:hypothetical protein [Blastocatellia bacterium]
MTPRRRITLRVVTADALDFEADVLALKYADSLYGVDKQAYERLDLGCSSIKLPKLHGFTLHDKTASIVPRKVLFVGVQPLRQFGYAEIREFGRKVLASLAGEAPNTRHLALTIHGPGYGLDEIEAFESELAGVVEAINSGDFPDVLEAISFIERNPGRAERLRGALKRLVPVGSLAIVAGATLSTLDELAQHALRSAGYASASKPHVFVAMPFASAMDDIFHYGIQGAANAAGLLCERADLSTFTGDVMGWVKNRISTARLVIADLSSANPNVYLEVGYAWGCNVPTVLIVRDSADLKFDVKGQRCIVYDSIKQLEDRLAHTLSSLVGD